MNKAHRNRAFCPPKVSILKYKVDTVILEPSDANGWFSRHGNTKKRIDEEKSR